MNGATVGRQGGRTSVAPRAAAQRAGGVALGLFPTIVGDTQIWFRHTPARDHFMHRLETEPGLLRRFDLISWDEHLAMEAVRDSRATATECWTRVAGPDGQDVWIPCDARLVWGDER